MKRFIESESEFTLSGTKKIYDIYEKERNTPIPPIHHTHSYYELIMVTEGEFKCQVELDTQFTLYAGDILFVLPFIPHATYRTSCETMKCTVVKFSPIYLYPSEITKSDVNYLLVEPKFDQSHYVFRNGEKGTTILSELLSNILQEYTEKKHGIRDHDARISEHALCVALA